MFIGQPATDTKAAGKWRIKSLKDTKPDMDAEFGSSAFLKWAQDYDAVGEVSENLILTDSKAYLKTGTEVPAKQEIKTIEGFVGVKSPC